MDSIYFYHSGNVTAYNQKQSKNRGYFAKKTGERSIALLDSKDPATQKYTIHMEKVTKEEAYAFLRRTNPFKKYIILSNPAEKEGYEKINIASLFKRLNISFFQGIKFLYYTLRNHALFSKKEKIEKKLATFSGSEEKKQRLVNEKDFIERQLTTTQSKIYHFIAQEIETKRQAQDTIKNILEKPEISSRQEKANLLRDLIREANKLGDKDFTLHLTQLRRETKDLNAALLTVKEEVLTKQDFCADPIVTEERKENFKEALGHDQKEMLSVEDETKPTLFQETAETETTAENKNVPTTTTQSEENTQLLDTTKKNQEYLDLLPTGFEEEAKKWLEELDELIEAAEKGRDAYLDALDAINQRRFQNESEAPYLVLNLEYASVKSLFFFPNQDYVKRIEDSIKQYEDTYDQMKNQVTTEIQQQEEAWKKALVRLKKGADSGREPFLFILKNIKKDYLENPNNQDTKLLEAKKTSLEPLFSFDKDNIICEIQKSKYRYQNLVVEDETFFKKLAEDLQEITINDEYLHQEHKNCNELAENLLRSLKQKNNIDEIEEVIQTFKSTFTEKIKTPENVMIILQMLNLIQEKIDFIKIGKTSLDDFKKIFIETIVADVIRTFDSRMSPLMSTQIGVGDVLDSYDPRKKRHPPIGQHGKKPSVFLDVPGQWKGLLSASLKRGINQPVSFLQRKIQQRGKNKPHKTTPDKTKTIEDNGTTKIYDDSTTKVYDDGTTKVYDDGTTKINEGTSGENTAKNNSLMPSSAPFPENTARAAYFKLIQTQSS